MVVFGDHGTQKNGVHGGSKDCELWTMFFSFTKGQKQQEKFNPKRPAPITNQTNIASTISFIGNVNTPFSNIGVGIPDLLTYPPDVNE